MLAETSSLSQEHGATTMPKAPNSYLGLCRGTGRHELQSALIVAHDARFLRLLCLGCLPWVGMASETIVGNFAEHVL